MTSTKKLFVIITVLLGCDYGLRLFLNTPRQVALVLIEAVRSRDDHTVRYLLEHGANINSKSDTGYTALHEAVLQSSLSIAEYLIARGADVNICNDDGEAPLLTAIVGADYHHELVELLINNGANINTPGQGGETCLMRAAACCFSPETISYFVEKGANVFAQNQEGKTAAMIAREDGCAATALWLEEYARKIS